MTAWRCPTCGTRWTGGMRRCAVCVNVLHEEPGWAGTFTRGEVDGALRNGTRVVKVTFDSKDAHHPGDLATVIGSFGVPEKFGYFVEWDDMPRAAVFVEPRKIRPAS